MIPDSMVMILLFYLDPPEPLTFLPLKENLYIYTHIYMCVCVYIYIYAVEDDML